MQRASANNSLNGIGMNGISDNLAGAMDLSLMDAGMMDSFQMQMPSGEMGEDGFGFKSALAGSENGTTGEDGSVLGEGM